MNKKKTFLWPVFGETQLFETAGRHSVSLRWCYSCNSLFTYTQEGADSAGRSHAIISLMFHYESHYFQYLYILVTGPRVFWNSSSFKDSVVLSQIKEVLLRAVSISASLLIQHDTYKEQSPFSPATRWSSWLQPSSALDTVATWEINR